MIKVKYDTVGKTLVASAKLDSSKRFPISVDQIYSFSADKELLKFRATNSSGTYTYETFIEDLINHIETSDDVESVMQKDGEYFLVPIDEKPFTRIHAKPLTDSEKWLATRARIIEESGGPWDHKKLQEWKAKFAAPTKPSN